MAFRRVGLTDAHPQRELVAQFRMRKIKISAAVERVHQFLIRVVC